MFLNVSDILNLKFFEKYTLFWNFGFMKSFLILPFKKKISIFHLKDFPEPRDFQNFCKKVIIWKCDFLGFTEHFELNKKKYFFTISAKISSVPDSTTWIFASKKYFSKLEGERERRTYKISFLNDGCYFWEEKSTTGSRVLHCTAELMVSSAVHGADAERLGVLRNVLPSSELGASLVWIVKIWKE